MKPNPQVLSASECRALDESAIRSGIGGAVLMETAGGRVAGVIRRQYGPRPVTVLCGPGNNGGDGFVIARHLQTSGWPVRVLLHGARSALSGDAAAMAARWEGPALPLTAEHLAAAGADGLIVDALFGTGLTRPLADDLAALPAIAAQSGAPVVAVDVPSGMASDSGALIGPCFKAAVTVTFSAYKPCHLLYPAKRFCGRVAVAFIGIPPELYPAGGAALMVNGPESWPAPYPFPTGEDHKYTRGHVLVMGGGGLHGGASRLSARAALRSGAGLVTLAVPPSAAEVYAAHLNAVMLHPVATPIDLAQKLDDGRITACLAGPGNGVDATTLAHLETLLSRPLPLVIDADGLSVLALHKQRLLPLAQPAILTPHAGEFKRLFPVTGDKVADTRAAAEAANAVIVHKGADTVIAAPDGWAAIQPDAPPWLATAGSGDVLAGLCAGLLGLGLDPFPAACQAVWLHSRAAFHHGPGMIAEDLTETIPNALADLKRSLP